MTDPYYETLKVSKIGKVPPRINRNNEKLRNIDKVTEFNAVTFNFYKNIV